MASSDLSTLFDGDDIINMLFYASLHCNCKVITSAVHVHFVADKDDVITSDVITSDRGL